MLALHCKSVEGGICQSSSNPCSKNGICYDGIGDDGGFWYICGCKPGWKGKTCDTESKLTYHMQASISLCLYIFYLIFHCGLYCRVVYDNLPHLHHYYPNMNKISYIVNDQKSFWIIDYMYRTLFFSMVPMHYNVSWKSPKCRIPYHKSLLLQDWVIILGFRDSFHRELSIRRANSHFLPAVILYVSLVQNSV